MPVVFERLVSRFSVRVYFMAYWMGIMAESNGMSRPITILKIIAPREGKKLTPYSTALPLNKSLKMKKRAGRLHANAQIMLGKTKRSA